MTRRYTTNRDLKAQSQGHYAIVDTIGTQILQDHEAEVRRDRGRAAPTDLGLLEMDLTAEVGRATPPVRIYRPDPQTGELVFKEQLTATTFRRKALESVHGKRFQARLAELQKKRRKAGMRSKANARAARYRLRQAGIKPRFSDEDEEAL